MRSFAFVDFGHFLMSLLDVSLYKLEAIDLRFSFTPNSVIENRKGSVCGNSWYMI